VGVDLACRYGDLWYIVLDILNDILNRPCR
jgi:hypothetical protein